MLGLKRRKPTVIVRSHWYRLIEGLHFSPLDFYSRVEHALAAREVPRLESSRLDIHEGNLLSAKREYLRLIRERLVFDVCGAPFGTGSFVSWRLAEVPLNLNPSLLLLLAAVLLIAVWQGYVISLLVLFLLGVIAIVVFRNVVGRALQDVDASLMKIPVIGPYYEYLCRPLTYYRIDVTLMYQQAVHAAVLEVVDELTKQAGLPPLPQSERAPILHELYSR